MKFLTAYTLLRQWTIKINIFIIFFLFILAYPALALDSEILYEQCYLLKSKGIEIGFICVTQRKNETEIITEKHIEQRFKRNNDNLEIIQDQIFIEDESGMPVSFSYDSKKTGEDIEINGRFNWNTNELVIDSHVNGVDDIKITEIKEKILFPCAIESLYKGTTDKVIKYNTIEPGINSTFLKIKAQKVENGESEKNEGNEGYKKFKISMNIFPNADIFEWRDGNGILRKSATSIMDMEQVAIDKKDIVNIKSDFNVFAESMIPVERAVNRPEKVSEAVYKITAFDIPVEKIFLNNDIQNIMQIQDNIAYIKVKAENYEGYSYSYPFNNKEYEEYLKTGPFIITNSSKIKQISERITFGETDSVKIAQKATSWVYNNITNKNLSVDFANAVQVLESGTGDCTEHSILLASVLRAAGIPSKVVVGLVYSNAPENGFFYHMWVEAFVGKWISLDPSFPYESFTPLHLAITESPLNDITDKNGLVIDVINSFSKIDIEILKVSIQNVVSVKGKPEIRVSLGNSDIDSLININNPGLFQSKINKVDLLENNQEEKDYLKSAFYNFTHGDTQQAYIDLKEFHKTVSPKDDYAKMKLALKLINMSYFNFALEVLNEINDTEIWGNMIDELHMLYLPKKFMAEDPEKIQVAAFYYLNYENKPQMTLDLTQELLDKDYKDYDYIYYLRAKAFKDLRQFEKAEEELKKAITINNKNLTYKLDLINILSSQNKISEAQKELGFLNLHAKKINIKNKEFWKKLQSYDYWLKVKELRENLILSKYYEAYYYAVKGELDLAAEFLNKLIYRQQESYLYELLGEVYYELEYYEFARKMWEKALDIDERRPMAIIGLGNIYFITGNNEKAEKYYQKALKMFPKNIDALLSMAKLQGYLGNTEKSYEYFKRVLSIDKENSDVIYNIGVILANNGKYEESEKLLKKALSADPMQSLIWFELAKLELVRNNYVESIQYLENVRYIDENDPYYYYFMSVILKKTKNIAESKKYLKKALELDPNIVKELKRKNNNENSN